MERKVLSLVLLVLSLVPGARICQIWRTPDDTNVLNLVHYVLSLVRVLNLVHCVLNLVHSVLSLVHGWSATPSSQYHFQSTRVA